MSDSRSLSNDEFAERMRQRRGKGVVCSACGQVFVFGGGKKGKCNKCLSTAKKKPKKKPIPGEPPKMNPDWPDPPGPAAPSVPAVPASMPAVPPVESLADRLKNLCVDVERALTLRGDTLFVNPDSVASWDWTTTTEPGWMAITMEVLGVVAPAGRTPTRYMITGQWHIVKRDFRVGTFDIKDTST